MSTMITADLLVIGFGKGGKTLAAALGAQGRRVVVVEQSAQMYGGTCINVGCVPTKSMVYRGEMRTSDGDGAAAYSEAVAATATLTAGLRAVNLGMFAPIPTATVLTGHAAFVDEHTVAVDTADGRAVVTASNIVIGTGSVPVIPDIPGLRDCPVALTSAELLSALPRPDRLVILGGGYIGLEFASMMAAYGTEVTVLERHSAILGGEDEDVATAVREVLAAAGVSVVTGVEIDGVESTSETSATIHFTAAGTESAAVADVILVALGRRPNTEDLSLHNAGVQTTPTGAIEVDEFRRASRLHIYAVGDVNGGPQFTYISLDDYRIVADQLAGADHPRSAADRVAVPSCLFLTPPLARVGMTERQARAAGHQVKTASSPVAKLATVARARIVDQTDGIMKVVVDAETDQFLGAALLCYDAHEVINLVAMAMRHRLTASMMRDEIYTHPSMSECFNQLLWMLR
ncbi:NAD(P)/FAD-dependent oxidoreductase [Mycobacterium sp. PS03-16]|uniref:FAD-dependent oxidoreductase n=1 Tax=Mycobacterium sp. PS03-16 TaxID=2559611 RepID=UPI00107441E6|nr:FAD-dependent oxidoreductase [Mycobacterium sp. PS03-16]TFV57884.1 NAD(P)/FAD-dependent oxidoreductase [Mycobacterium sp. PS03-16]